MEDYEKKYKEALSRAATELETCGADKSLRNMIYAIFPDELKESEDEKIRKALVDALNKNLGNGIEKYGTTLNAALTWLEKQGKSSDQIHYWTEEEIEPIISDYLRGVEHYGGMIGRLRCLKPKSLEKQNDCSVKWQKNTPNYKPAINHSVLMKTTQGIAEGEWQGEDWFQYRWSWTLKDSDVLAWMELSNLDEQGEQKPAVVDFNAKDWYVSKVDGKIHDMTYNPADKVEPKFKVGDVLCDKSCTTLDKNSQPNIEILDIRNGMYICNNCSFPISQQDEYELVAKFDKYEGLTDFERALADICIGWIGEELGWKQYIKDNADVLLKIAIKKFNSIQDAPFEQKSAAWSEEDEKIRNALIKGVECCKASGWTNFGNNVDIDVVLAWLEKQGEQKPIDYNEELKKCRENPLYFFDKYVKLEEQKSADKVEPKFKVGDMVCKKKDNSFCATINSITDTVYLCDVFDSDGDYDDDYAFLISEQDEYELVEKIKPQSAWSEEDEEMTEDLIKGCISAEKAHHFVHTSKEIADWLKSIKDRVQPQPKQEWSEEDENMLATIIEEGYLTPSEKQWLKSLKERIGG